MVHPSVCASRRHRFTFSRLLPAFLPHVPANGRFVLTTPVFRPLFPNSSGSRLYLRDVFPAVAAACLRVTLRIAGTYLRCKHHRCSSHRLDTTRGTGQRTLSTAFPIFHAAAGRSEKRIATNHSLSTTTQAARSRARVSVARWIDSAFLRRSMLICSLLLLFVRGNRHLRKRYRLPVRIARNNEILFRDCHLDHKQRENIRKYKVIYRERIDDFYKVAFLKF